MKEQTRRRGSAVSRFITALGLAQIMAGGSEASPVSAAVTTNMGAPMFTPKRTKFKGYMRSKQYKAKHR